MNKNKYQTSLEVSSVSLQHVTEQLPRSFWLLKDYKSHRKKKKRRRLDCYRDPHQATRTVPVAPVQHQHSSRAARPATFVSNDREGSVII